MTREKSLETPSARKNRQLFEQAGSGNRPVEHGTLTGTRWHGSRCGACVHFPCIKNPTETQNYCANPGHEFKRKVEA